MRHEVAVLCDPRIWHQNTCATLIAADLDEVGICEADDRRAALPVQYVFDFARKRGLAGATSRVAARLLYLMENWRLDRTSLQQLFDRDAIERTLRNWSGATYRTARFDDPGAADWLRRLRADVFVVHSGQIIPNSILDLPESGIVLGGHPGLTPAYRGAHSAFWAIRKGRVHDVGCTIFLVDAGIDRGAIVAQQRIRPEPGDSYFTLGGRA